MHGTSLCTADIRETGVVLCGALLSSSNSRYLLHEKEEMSAFCFVISSDYLSAESTTSGDDAGCGTG